MKGKKGLEIAIGTVVILIITVIIFGLSIYIGFRVFGGAKEAGKQVEMSTQQEIERMLREENAKVAIPFNTLKVNRGQQATFGLGVRNLVGKTAHFGVAISFDKAYTLDDKVIQNTDSATIEDAWLGSFMTIEPFSLKNNAYEAIPLVVKTGSKIATGVSTIPGSYVFNVCVYCVGESPCLSTPLNSCSVGQTGVYDKIKQITVEVK